MSCSYTYRTEGPATSPLSTPSTCFSSRYFSSSSASYRTPYSRYDRSYSTPVRYSESPSYYYNRCISDSNIPPNRSATEKEGSRTRTYYHNDYVNSFENDYHSKNRTYPDILTRYRQQTSPNNHYSRDNHFETDDNISDKYCEKKKIYNPPTDIDCYRHIRKSPINTPRPSNPLYSDHVARFYQRITDIFEKDESKPREEKSFSQSDLIRKQRPSYRTLITDDWEAKNKKVNEGVEQRRGLKEFGYLRQSYLLSA